MKNLILLAAFLFLVACGSESSNNNQEEIQGFDKVLSQLVGKEFVGLDGQGGEPMVGCEGCGNPGYITFISENTVDILRPGDDQIFRESYIVTSENTVLADNGDIFRFTHEYSQMTASSDQDGETLGYGEFELNVSE